ncbi:hypothetical protein Tco_0200015 [Tanacetum coccineum]
MSSDHNSSKLGIHDHNNEQSNSKLVPKVVPLADKIATSPQELELLFHHHITMLRSQGGKDDQDKQGKDLKISELKTKSKDNDKGSRSKITQSAETEFPAIAFNDGVSSEKTLSCEPTVNSLNDEIDFRILFDDSDDEDYTIVFDKNSFSYKIISTNDLKKDSENDNEKVMPLLPSPEPTVSCFDDLDFFKDFENEFPAIVYNDAQTSKSDLLTEPILNSKHIDEFDLNDERSLSKYDEEEQNILYFNDLFPFNVIHPDDSKSDKDNDDDKVDTEHSLGIYQTIT